MYINCCIPWIAEKDKFEKLISLVHQLGYQGALVDFKDIKEYQEYQKSEFSEVNPPKIDFPLTITSLTTLKTEKNPIILIPRITISAQNPHVLKQKLAKNSQTKALLAIQSQDQQVLEVAARDGRVDMLALVDTEHIKSLSDGIISLAKQNDCILDLNITEIIKTNHFHRTRILRVFYRLFQTNSPFNHLFSIGFYSEIKSNPWLLRGPKELSAILTSIFNIPRIQSKNIIKNNGEILAMRYLKRVSNTFIEPGVEIVDEMPLSDKNHGETGK